jgi:glycosyltransferase involved in cell wall biosynthesis
MGPELSVILSTHERPDALAVSLEGVRAAAAGAGELEVVVADDGSGPETAEVVRRFGASADFPVGHVRQEHHGFRLAASRNGAVRAARGEVLVFVDGDCILRPDALRLHRERCRPLRAHTGARQMLEPQETSGLLERALEPWTYDFALVETMLRERRRLRRLYFANLFYRFFHLKPRPKLAAANCAVHRSDFAAVNGFDERFIGWGYEDDDLARRLRRRGVRIIDGTLDCLALHLFHQIHPSHRPSARGTENDRYFHQNRFLTRCRRGLERRPLESLRYEVLGEPPAALSPFLRELEGRPGAAPLPPEVSLLFPGGFRRHRGEVPLRLPPEVLMGGIPAFREFLEEVL